MLTAWIRDWSKRDEDATRASLLPMELPDRGPARADRGLVATALDGDVADVLAAAGTLPNHPVDAARHALSLTLAARRLSSSIGADDTALITRAVLETCTRASRAAAGADEVEASTAIAAAMLGWNDLPGARSRLAKALTVLNQCGGERVLADGSPPDGDALALLAWVETALLLARDARREGFALPERFRGAVAAAAWHLYVRSSPDGLLPGGRRRPVIVPIPALVIAARNATVALGWAGGVTGDETAWTTWFTGGRAPRAIALGDTDWSIWSFAEGRVAVLRSVHRGEPSRVVVDAGWTASGRNAPCPELTLGAIPVLERDASTIGDAEPGPSRFTMTRVDVPTGRGSRKGRVIAFVPVRGGTWRREVTVRQARFVVEDSPPDNRDFSCTWRLTSGWTVDLEAKLARHESGRSVKLDLDERLTWQVEPSAAGPVIGGRGAWNEEGGPVKFGIEWT